MLTHPPADGAAVVTNEPVIPDFGEASACVSENRFFCTDWVRDNWGPVLQPRLIEHIELTLIAVSIGFVISLAAALLAHRLRLVERPIAFVSAVIYTIPSLALFQLLVPLTGLTVTTVEIALVGYTLLILFRNILAGLRSAPPEVLEAARGMGLTPTQTLWRVELPLALPAIVAGLRIAVVSTIALATVAAFVVSQGSRRTDPGRAAPRLQDRDHRRRRPRRRRWRSSPTRFLVLVQRAGDALGGNAEDGVILAALDVFVNSFDFIVDQRHLMLEKTWEHIAPVGGCARRLDLRRRSARRHAGPPASRLVRRSQPGERRPGAPDPRRDRGRLHLPRPRLHERDGRARRAGGAADPDERLRGGRRGRSGRGRGGAGHGDDAARRCSGASSSRSRCRSSSPASARPSSSSIATATIAAIAGGGGLGEILANQASLSGRGRRGRGDLRVAARARRRRCARPRATLR